MQDRQVRDLFIGTCLDTIFSMVGDREIDTGHTYIFKNHDEHLFLELSPADEPCCMQLYVEYFDPTSPLNPNLPRVIDYTLSFEKE